MKTAAAISLLLLSLFILETNAVAVELIENTSALLPLDGKYRFTFDSVDMPPPDDRLGLFGFHYLVDMNPNIYIGFGGFGSASGDRGGFLTGGFTGGLQKQLLGNLWFDGGLFLGAGGGGGTPQGDGLMIRPYAGLRYDFRNLSLGLAYSQVHFPKTEIDSDNIAVSIDFPFNVFIANDRPVPTAEAVSELSTESGQLPGFIRKELLLNLRSNYPQSSVKNTAGIKSDTRLDLIGVQFRHFLNRQSYVMVEAMGAFGGDAAGYAEVLAGGGYRFDLSHDKLDLTLGIALGSGGGGMVDTGGGTIWHTTAGLEYWFTPACFAVIDGGYIDSDGSFKATTAGVRIGYTLENFGSGVGTGPLYYDDTLRWDNWRIRGGHLTYTDPERKAVPSIDEKVQLATIKADLFFNDTFYLTGQAAGAYDGQAGGYAVGLIGIGLQSAQLGSSGVRFVSEILVGAAGGGGIAVDDGIIVQPMIGIEYAFNDKFSIQVLGGQVEAIDGNLSSPVIDAALTWRFSTLSRVVR